MKLLTIGNISQALSAEEKENFLEMMVYEKFKRATWTTPGLGGDTYMRAKTDELVESGKMEPRKSPAWVGKQKATLPSERSTNNNFVSVATKKSYCYLLLKQMIHDGMKPSAEVGVSYILSYHDNYDNHGNLNEFRITRWQWVWGAAPGKI